MAAFSTRSVSTVAYLLWTVLISAPSSVCAHHGRRLVSPKFRNDPHRHEQTIANSGIGLESSLLFAKEGANVLLVDINLPAAERAASLINQRFPNVKALAVKVDVAKEQDIKSAVEVAVKEFGRLDIMV